MSAHPISAPDVRVFSLLDVILVTVSLPVLLLAGAPALGTAVGAAAWILQRLVALAIESRARRQESVRQVLALNLGGSLVRAWFVALAILAVGTAGTSEDGLAAALLVAVAFTLYLVLAFVRRAIDRGAAAG